MSFLHPLRGCHDHGTTPYRDNGRTGECLNASKSRLPRNLPVHKKRPGSVEPGLLSAVADYLADEDEAAPLPPVELDAPEPEAGAGDDEDDDDPEDGAGADEDDDDDPDGAGVVEDEEDEPPGTTTVVFSFVLLLLVLEPLVPVLPGATTVSLFSLQAPSASAPSRTNIHEPCFLVISSPWG